MARYLGPAKVALLVLTELYADDGLPASAIVPVLSFIASYGIVKAHPFETCAAPAPPRWHRAEATVSLVVTLRDIEELLAGHDHVAGLPGRKLWDVFLVRLWSINSLDALSAFFLRLPRLLQKTKEQKRRVADGLEEPDDDDDHGPDKDGKRLGRVRLARKSPLGSFVRRAWTEFVRLPFHLSVQLWKDFVRYRQPTVQYLRRRKVPVGRLAFDSVLQDAENGDEWDQETLVNVASVTYNEMILTGDDTPFSVTTSDVEMLLEFHIDQMQKYGSRVPNEIRFQLDELLRDSSAVPSMAHYVAFLDGWRSGDYNLAFENLHRYFDYTMQNRDKTYYQYALMNLAVLNADFGCHREAVDTMLETVTTARENRDMVCLNFALNWMFHFARAHPDVVEELERSSVLGTRKESLAFLRVKAKELGMSNLRSSVLVTEAKMALWNGDSVATAYELLARSSQLIVTRNIRSVVAQHLLLYASLWNRLGLAHVAGMTGLVIRRCHARHSLFNDELRVVCGAAQALAARGRYDEALALLEDAVTGPDEGLRSWYSSTYWHKQRGVVMLLRDLYSGNDAGAERLLTQLLGSGADDLEPDLCAVIDELHVRALVRRGDLGQAFDKVEEMITRLREDKKDVLLRVNALLLKATLYAECGRPERGFTLAMRAAGAAWRARLMPVLWNALGAVANILVSLGSFAPAAELLVAVLPRSLEGENLAASARLFSGLADAYMGLAGQQASGNGAGAGTGAGTGKGKGHHRRSSSSGGRKTEMLDRAATALDQSLQLWAALGDGRMQREMVAKKAVVARLEGREDEAGAHAATYAALCRGETLAAVTAAASTPR